MFTQRSEEKALFIILKRFTTVNKLDKKYYGGYFYFSCKSSEGILPKATMTEKNKFTSIIDSFLTSFAFTKKGKDIKKTLKKVNRPTFFRLEKERVREIQTLVNKRQHSAALKQLLQDTDAENPVQYYNKIRNVENGEKFGSEIKERTNIKESTNSGSNLPKDDQCAEKCGWTGFNRKYDQLSCENNVFSHPWKQVLNVCGQIEPVKSDFCAYHQKYCIDEDNFHEGAKVRIVVPNEFGLCSECFVLKVGSAPLELRRFPGLRRKHNLEERSILQPKAIDKTADSKESSEPLGEAKKARKESQRMTQTVATAMIAEAVRKHIRKKRILKKYFLDRLRNRSALQIQSSYRHFQLRQRLKVKAINFKFQNNNEIHSYENQAERANESTLPESILDALDSEALDTEFPAFSVKEETTLADIRCLPCNPLKSRGKFIKKGRKAERKCEAAACQICIPIKRTKATGRQEIISGLPRSKHFVLAMEEPFRTRDTFNLGSLPRNEFLYILDSFWMKSGQPLLLEEIQSIVNAFECRDGRDGHIDYEKYVAFASQQIQPCSIHSRLVCPHPMCIQRSSCKRSNKCRKFEEDPLNPSFCLCGKYKSRHEPIPLQGVQEKRKRGFNIYSNDDLKRTFRRHTNPDTRINIKFEFLEDVASLKKSATLKSLKGRPKPSSKDHKKESVTNSSNLSLRPTPRSIKAAKIESSQMKIKDRSGELDKSSVSFYTKFHNHSDKNSTKLSVPTGHIQTIKFSPRRLESMLDQCVQYRDVGVEPKATTPCPLCNAQFFSTDMLESHLTRRHTLHEIEYEIKMRKDNTTTQGQIRVEWVGKAAIVPPLQPPVPMKLCFHHVPPHPKCRVCNELVGKSPLFPPIRFYDSGFMEYRYRIPCKVERNDDLHDGGERIDHTETVLNFHFNVGNHDLAIVYQEDGCDEQIGHVAAICEDGRKKYYVGVQRYVPEVSRSIQEGMRNKDELIMESKINFVEMKKVIGRRHVFQCTKDQFVRKKQEMNIGNLSHSHLKYCELMLKEGELLPLAS